MRDSHLGVHSRASVMRHLNLNSVGGALSWSVELFRGAHQQDSDAEHAGPVGVSQEMLDPLPA